jgi:hypothetical protein
VPHLEVENFAMDVSLVASARGLCKEFLEVVCHQPSAKRRGADHRFSGRISQGEHIPYPEHIPLQI